MSSTRGANDASPFGSVGGASTTVLGTPIPGALMPNKVPRWNELRYNRLRPLFSSEPLPSLVLPFSPATHTRLGHSWR